MEKSISSNVLFKLEEEKANEKKVIKLTTVRNCKSVHIRRCNRQEECFSLKRQKSQNAVYLKHIANNVAFSFDFAQYDNTLKAASAATESHHTKKIRIQEKLHMI